MGLTEVDLVKMRPLVAAFMSAVARSDETAIRAVYEDTAKLLRVYPSHAIAVVLADELRTVRERWAAANAEATRYAEAYLDEKRRVRELREILGARAAAADPGRGKAYA